MSKVVISESVGDASFSVYDDGLCVFTQGDDCVEMKPEQWSELMGKAGAAIQKLELEVKDE